MVVSLTYFKLRWTSLTFTGVCKQLSFEGRGCLSSFLLVFSLDLLLFGSFSSTKIWPPIASHCLLLGEGPVTVSFVLIFTKGEEVDKTEFLMEDRELFLGLSMFLARFFTDCLAWTVFNILG